MARWNTRDLLVIDASLVGFNYIEPLACARWIPPLLLGRRIITVLVFRLRSHVNEHDGSPS